MGSDWTDWEVGRSLYLNEKWLQVSPFAVCGRLVRRLKSHVPTLRYSLSASILLSQAILDEPLLGAVEEFRLELEVWDAKKSQLDSIVDRVRILEGKPKLADPTDPKSNRAAKFVFKGPPETWHWSRSPRLQDEDWPIFKDISTLNLHAVILKWRAEYVPVNCECLSPGPPLKATEAALLFPRPIQSLREFSLPTLAHHVALVSFARAEAMEQVRRDRFERQMGDLEAKKLIEEWDSKGSLLKLERTNDSRVGRPLNERPDLSWLNKFRI